MAELHETRMGRDFYDRTMPELVRQLHRLNDNLERRAAPDLCSAPAILGVPPTP